MRIRLRESAEADGGAKRKAPELRHRALKAGEQRRGEDVLAFQGYGELQRRQLPAKDLQRAVLPVGDPVFTDALARVQVELQLPIPTLVDGPGERISTTRNAASSRYFVFGAASKTQTSGSL